MKNHQHGFTLLETLIYLSLYAVIMSGALVSVYALFGSSSRNQIKAMVQEEGTFLVGKIDWALIGISNISAPSVGTSGNILTTTKFDATVGNPVVISILSSGDVTLSRNGSTYTLNNSNILVTCPVSGCFTHTSGSGDGINPEVLSASFTVSATSSDGIGYSQSFKTAKYMRK